MNSPIPIGALAVPTIPCRLIIPSATNPRKRFDPAYIAELAKSIKSHGVIQPITVRPISSGRLLEWNSTTHEWMIDENPQYEIIVGECRWRAAMLAGLTDIPGYWRDLDDKQVLEIQVIENLQRRDVHPLEEADGYRTLIDKHGYTADEIGEKIGKSRSYVYSRMKLSALGDIAREAFFDGEFDASVALLIARIPDEKDQRKIINELRNCTGTDQPISFRDAKYRIRNGFTKDLTMATFKPDDADLLPSAGSCSECPKRSGNHPELFPDTDSADVCTDPRCYEEKRLARHQQLLDGYEKRQIKVVTGEEVKTIAPYATDWCINRDEWVTPDDEVDDDPEQRTYREILGDAFPVTTVVEVKGNNGNKLVELASVTAIAEALQKAGITTGSNNGDDDTKPVTPTAKAQTDTQWVIEKRERETKIQTERERRAQLLTEIKARLIDDDGSFNTDPIITALAIASLRQETAYNELPSTMLESYGIKFPDPWEDAVMLEVTCTAIKDWPIGKVLAFLAELFSEDERYDVYDHSVQDVTPCPGLNAVAHSIDIDPDTFVGALPTTQAAQAGEDQRAESGGLAIGDRVRIRNDIAIGTAAWRRKVSGREGVIEAFAEGLAYFDVRVGEGKSGLVKGLTFNEVDRLDPATQAAQAGESTAASIETNETPTGAGAGEGNGQAVVIETNEKPTEAAAAVGYRHPENDQLTWSGKGKKPKWVTAYLAIEGNTLDGLKVAA